MKYLGYSFFKRGARWYIEYTDANGDRKQRSTGCSQKSDALKVLSDFKEVTASAPQSRSFSTFKDEFLVYAEGTFAGTTVKIYRASLNNFQRILGDMPLSSITTAHSDLYKAKRQKDYRRNRIRPRKTAHLSLFVSNYARSRRLSTPLFGGNTSPKTRSSGNPCSSFPLRHRRSFHGRTFKISSAPMEGPPIRITASHFDISRRDIGWKISTKTGSPIVCPALERRYLQRE